MSGLGTLVILVVADRISEDRCRSALRTVHPLDFRKNKLARVEVGLKGRGRVRGGPLTCENTNEIESLKLGNEASCTYGRGRALLYYFSS